MEDSRSAITATTVGGCTFEELCNGIVQNYACDNTVDIRGSDFQQAKQRILTHIDDCICELEIARERRVKKIYIGKTFIRRRKAPRGYVPIDPLNHWTYKKGGLGNRWREHRSKDYGRHGMIVLAVIPREAVPSSAMPGLQQEDYTFALEQTLLHHFMITNYDPRIANDSFATGGTDVHGSAAYALYMAFALEDEEEDTGGGNDFDDDQTYTTDPNHLIATNAGPTSTQNPPQSGVTRSRLCQPVAQDSSSIYLTTDCAFPMQSLHDSDDGQTYTTDPTHLIATNAGLTSTQTPPRSRESGSHSYQAVTQNCSFIDLTIDSAFPTQTLDDSDDGQTYTTDASHFIATNAGPTSTQSPPQSRESRSHSLLVAQDSSCIHPTANHAFPTQLSPHDSTDSQENNLRLALQRTRHWKGIRESTAGPSKESHTTTPLPLSKSQRSKGMTKRRGRFRPYKQPRSPHKDKPLTPGVSGPTTPPSSHRSHLPSKSKALFSVPSSSKPKRKPASALSPSTPLCLPLSIPSHHISPISPTGPSHSESPTPTPLTPGVSGLTISSHRSQPSSKPKAPSSVPSSSKPKKYPVSVPSSSTPLCQPLSIPLPLPSPISPAGSSHSESPTPTTSTTPYPVSCTSLNEHQSVDSLHDPADPAFIQNRRLSEIQHSFLPFMDHVNRRRFPAATRELLLHQFATFLHRN